MAIKKAFIDVFAFLQANENKKVGTILDDVRELCSAKGAGAGGASTIHRDEDGNVVAIHDYYFKKWLPVEFVEFGSKANSASGFSTMCKLGTSLWTKQQRDFKKGKEALLDAVASGEVAPGDIQDRLDQLEAARSHVEPYPVPEVAFDSIDELMAADRNTMAAAVERYQAEQAAEQEQEEETVAE